jgi:hypothetical protein
LINSGVLNLHLGKTNYSLNYLFYILKNNNNQELITIVNEKFTNVGMNEIKEYKSENSYNIPDEYYNSLIELFKEKYYTKNNDVVIVPKLNWITGDFNNPSIKNISSNTIQFNNSSSKDKEYINFFPSDKIKIEKKDGIDYIISNK